MMKQTDKLVFINLTWVTDYFFEIHAKGCKDIHKKESNHTFTIESLEEAKEIIECENDVYQEESGNSNSGYYMDLHAKVFPCVKKVAA